jgi:hypothetical protein
VFFSSREDEALAARGGEGGVGGSAGRQPRSTKRQMTTARSVECLSEVKELPAVVAISRGSRIALVRQKQPPICPISSPMLFSN